jgi:hypothetical protein
MGRQWNSKSNLLKTNYRVQFSDRLESNEEIDTILNASFGKATTLNAKEFLEVTENTRSELFLYVNFKFHKLDSYIFVGETSFLKNYNKRAFK